MNLKYYVKMILFYIKWKSKNCTLKEHVEIGWKNIKKDSNRIMNTGFTVWLPQEGGSEEWDCRGPLARWKLWDSGFTGDYCILKNSQTNKQINKISALHRPLMCMCHEARITFYPIPDKKKKSSFFYFLHIVSHATKQSPESSKG